MSTPARRLAARRSIADLLFVAVLLFVLGPGIAFAANDEPIALTPVIGLDPAALNFAPCLAPGDCTTLTFDIFNAANDPDSRLEVTSVELVAPQFSLLNPPALPLIIPGDGTRVTFSVQFCATGDPEIGVVIVLASNALNSPAQVTLFGDGNFPPVCDAGGPYAGSVGSFITFDGSRTQDPDADPLAYTWDFGDGTTGIGVEVQHRYTAVGSYNVTLHVEDVCQVARSCTTLATIAPGNMPPVCNTGGPYFGRAGVPIQFDGSLSNDPDGTIVSYSWDFGDGQSGTGATPLHTYTATGVYTVTLRVRDDQGALSTCQTPATIAANTPPVCDAGGPYAAVVGEPIQFDGSGSYDPDGIISSYFWDFGDGQSGTGATPLHTYTAPSTYNVVLRVRDDLGASSLCSTVAVVASTNVLPVCDADGPYLGRVAVEIRFDGSGSYDPDGTIADYTWHFGDGATGQGVAPGHRYSQSGTYVVALFVTDNRGGTSSCNTEARITAGSTPLTPVIGIAPEALDFGACTPLGGTADLTFDVFNVVFDPLSILNLTSLSVAGAQFALAGGPSLPVAIPGDGTRVTFTLRFTPDSNQTVAGTLTASAPGAVNSPLSVPLTGRGNTPPLCVAGGPYVGIVGEVVLFDGRQSADPGGGVTGYTWDFGDGATGSGPTPQHVYTVGGTYTVRLTVGDACQATSSCTTTAVVLVPPICNAGGPYLAFPGTPVQFDGRASYDPDGTIVDYAWDFGDGSTGSGPTPTHTYLVPATWVVTLTVRDNDGITRSCNTIVSMGATPVAGVDSLAAEVRGAEVLLTWRAAHARDLLGFEVWRAGGTESGARIDRDLVTDDDADGRLSFLDRHAVAGERLLYEIFAVGRGGEREAAGSVAVDVPALAFALHSPRPHPAPLPIEIAFDLPHQGHARARVAAAGGRIVAGLLDEDVPAGRHVISWSGRDTRGGLAPAGVYLVVLEFGGESRREKLVLIR